MTQPLYLLLVGGSGGGFAHCGGIDLRSEPNDRDGEEALEFLSCTGRYAALEPAKPAKWSLKVILLDLKLPKVSGIDVLRHIKSDKRLRLVPVVVMTSSHEERDVVETYDLGVNSYIVKPVLFEQFSESVRQVGMYWLLLNQPPVPARTDT